MKYLKKFESFVEADTQVKPAKPITKPTTRPNRNPIPFKRPAVDPAPKATAEDVAKKFISLMKKSGEDVSKYINK